MHISELAANECGPDGKGLAATLQAALLPKHDAAGPGASDLGNGQRLARQPLVLTTLHLKEASFICEEKKPFYAPLSAAARRPETITDYSGRANVITELVLSILLKR